MTTGKEFLESGITGQTFREINEKFGKTFNDLSVTDPAMANFALGFAWFREREHLAVPDAYDKAMGLTTTQVGALFEDSDVPEVKAAADFDSPPPVTTP